MLNKLPQYVVGIDVETTSLEPAHGDIIDVAAIRFDLISGQEVDRFTSLTRPRQPISTEITVLTGITQDMVADQPQFSEIVGDLKTFIGTDAIFAHNASFDLNFLSFHGLPLKNPVWDTFPLATIAWPESDSYNLGFLVDTLGIPKKGEHRATDDVLMTWDLLQHIRKSLAVEGQTYQKVIETAAKAGLDHYLPLFSVQKESEEEQPLASSTRNKTTANTSVSKSTEVSAVDLLGPDGPLAKSLANFTPRESQRTMSGKVESILEETGIGLIEASTGIGKSYAYLIPALKSASQDKPVIVATHTRHLQDQIVERDIPTLSDSLDLARTVALLKGRRNYVCETRLGQLLGRATITETDAFLLIKILLWLSRGSNGDIERLNISHQSPRLLRYIHADAISCRQQCQPQGECPYQKARRQAKDAELVVINHALLAQLSQGEENYLNLSRVIIDEAHHFAESLREATRIDFSADRVSEIVAPLVQLARKKSDQQRASHITDEAKQLVSEYTGLLRTAATLLSQTAYSLRIAGQTRRSRRWRQVEDTANKWHTRMKFIIGLTKSMAEGSRKQEREILEQAVGDMEQFAIEFKTFIEGSSERVQWLERQWQGNQSNASEPDIATLNDVALNIAPITQALTAQADSLILTSATLTTEGNFDFTKKQLGIEPTVEEVIPSEFNYRKNMLIYLVEDGPLPGNGGAANANYANILAEMGEKLINIFSGRTLILCSSQGLVKDLYRILIKKLNKDEVKLYAQKMTGGRTNMTKRFRENPHSVLIGTSSFWEGIDIPGDSLSSILIPKLPFLPPHDPVADALAEAEAANTNGRSPNTFATVSLPHMILRLRQGVGRLIRTSTDRGVVVIADPRLTNREYADCVLQSLPPATIRTGSQAELTDTITQWFGDKELAALKK